MSGILSHHDSVTSAPGKRTTAIWREGCDRWVKVRVERPAVGNPPPYPPPVPTICTHPFSTSYTHPTRPADPPTTTTVSGRRPVHASLSVTVDYVYVASIELAKLCPWWGIILFTVVNWISRRNEKRMNIPTSNAGYLSKRPNTVHWHWFIILNLRNYFFLFIWIHIKPRNVVSRV